MLNWIVWNRTVFRFNRVQKMSTVLFKNVIYKTCLEILYSIYMYKNDSTLNNLQWLVCHETKPNQTKQNVNSLWETILLVAQSAGAVEYTDCKTPPNECPGYDTKQSDGEVPAVLELWGMRSTPFIAIAPRSTLARRMDLTGPYLWVK